MLNCVVAFASKIVSEDLATGSSAVSPVYGCSYEVLGEAQIAGRKRKPIRSLRCRALVRNQGQHHCAWLSKPCKAHQNLDLCRNGLVHEYRVVDLGVGIVR